jgi:hypothetical protein
MDYSGYASNLSAKTRMYIERNGDPEQKLNYALKAYSQGFLGEAPDELVGSDEKKSLYMHAYEDGVNVRRAREQEAKHE